MRRFLAASGLGALLEVGMFAVGAPFAVAAWTFPAVLSLWALEERRRAR